MANPATDRLAAVPGTPSWQRDATTNDSNIPQDSDPSDETTPTGLPSQMRNIKSVVRAFSLDSAWANYTGDELAPSADPPTKLSNSSFRLEGDWTDIATRGRRVRVTMTTGAKVIATILNIPTFTAGVTDITLDDSVISSDISYVEFSQLGSCLEAGPLPFLMDIVGNDFVIPPEHGGTGIGSSDFAGDVSGTFPNTTVEQLQGNQPVSATAPGAVADKVLYWDGAQWVATALSTLLHLVENISNPDAETNKGTIAFPYAGSTTSAIKVKWATQRFTLAAAFTGSLTLTYDSAFASRVFAVVISYGFVNTANNGRINFAWREAATTVASRSLTQAVLDYLQTVASADDLSVTVVALGI